MKHYRPLILYSVTWSPPDHLPPARQLQTLREGVPFVQLSRSIHGDYDSDMRGSISGTSGPLKREHPNRYLLFGILDCFISTLIVGPAVIGYWRSVWLLLGLYIFPENPLVSNIISTVLGNLGHLVFTLSQGFLKKHLHPSRNKFLFYVCSRFYTAVYAFICVNWWRGPWNLLDLYTGTEVTSVVFITTISIAALVAMRTLRNVSAAPCGIMLDTAESYFEVVTMFRVVSDLLPTRRPAVKIPQLKYLSIKCFKFKMLLRSLSKNNI